MHDNLFSVNFPRKQAENMFKLNVKEQKKNKHQAIP